jgi:hypothetical protein
MTEFEVVVTEADVREYDALDLARKEKFARVALKSAPVKFDWVSPELNPDGSLADDEQIRAKRKADAAGGARVKQQWSGTRQGNSGSGTSKKGWS